MSDLYGSESERINSLIGSNKQLQLDNLGTMLDEEQQQNLAGWKEKADEYAHKYSALAEGGGAELAGALGLEGAFKTAKKIKGLYDNVQERKSAIQRRQQAQKESNLKEDGNLNDDPEGFPTAEEAQSETTQLRNSLSDRFNTQSQPSGSKDIFSNPQELETPEAQAELFGREATPFGGSRPPPARAAEAPRQEVADEDISEIQPAEESGATFSTQISSAVDTETALSRTVSSQNIGDSTIRTNNFPNENTLKGREFADSESGGEVRSSIVISEDPNINPFAITATKPLETQEAEQSGNSSLEGGQLLDKSVNTAQETLNDGKSFLQNTFSKLQAKGQSIREGFQNVKNTVSSVGDEVGQQVGTVGEAAANVGEKVGEEAGADVGSVGEDLAGMATTDAILGGIPLLGEAALGITGLVSIGEGLYHLFHHSSKPPPPPNLPQVHLAASNPSAGLTQKFSMSLPSLDSSAEPSASTMSF